MFYTLSYTLQWVDNFGDTNIFHAVIKDLMFGLKLVAVLFYQISMSVRRLGKMVEVWI